MNPSCYLLINNRYIIGKKLGTGSFGIIYYGIDKTLPSDNKERLVAIKLEHKKNTLQLLKYESDVYKYLYTPNKGIPKLYWSGVQDDYNAMVIEMLGPTLSDLLRICGNKFTLKTTIMISQEIIKRLAYVHSKGIVHRDIKPENFLIGLNTNDVYIIDFGLCKLFKNSDNTHIPPNKNKKMIGTIRYTSLNSHTGNELSRRDDLISVGYMFIYFMKGTLPWQGLGSKGMSRDEKYNLIYECKKNTTIETLCSGLPKEFKLYMDHVCSLSFEEKPNYNYLYNIFTQLFKKHNFVYDGVYDWSTIEK